MELGGLSEKRVQGEQSREFAEYWTEYWRGNCYMEREPLSPQGIPQYSAEYQSAHAGEELPAVEEGSF